VKDLVFEIGTEEMPAGFIPQALEELKGRFSRWMEEERVEGEGLRALGTPRRLALLARLSERQRPLETLKLGPPKKVAFDPEGRPTKAALGFAQQQGVGVDELVVVETERGEYVGVKRQEEGRLTRELLESFLPRLVLSLPLPKAMRWADLQLRFVRPIHWVLAVFGGEILDLEIGGLRSGPSSRGHRFMAPEPFEVRDIDNYLRGLRRAYVLVDPVERRERVQKEVEEAARRAGGEVLWEGGLLEEVTNLVEWPVAVTGKFDEEFLQLPREVLITAMEHHQRYFPVVDGEGKLMPFFVAVANTQARDMEVVRKGNERVLQARLADAKFFYEEDLKVPLERRVEGLKGVVFQAKLGTLYEKVQRVQTLAKRLAERLCPEEVAVVQRAAYLCKADLLTEMVGEFPQLEGVMGREYALRGGESPAVAQTIFEHHLPRFSGDKLPESHPGAVLSIADKMDTVVGCFSVGLIPTGTSDPFAVRRQTLGVIHTVLDKGYRLSLGEVIRWALESLGQKVQRPPAEVEEEVLEFFRGRYEGLLLAEGWPRDEVEAVLEVQREDLVDAKRRIEALHRFRSSPDFESMIIAFKRVANIVKGRDYPDDPQPGLFKTREEGELLEAYRETEAEFRRLMEGEDYGAILSLFSRLRPVVDRFFDNVLVMEKDESLRANRLALLGKVYGLFSQAADFSRIVLQGDAPKSTP